jgi:uncharacterized protein YpiB (UPF0302 family)
MENTLLWLYKTALLISSPKMMPWYLPKEKTKKKNENNILNYVVYNNKLVKNTNFKYITLKNYKLLGF